MPLLQRVDHIGIATRDLDAAVQHYTTAFGIQDWELLELPERHMRVAICNLGNMKLELIMPTSDQAAFTRFLQERGEGIHHIAYEVDDIGTALDTVARRGIKLIDAEGRPGIHGTCVAFLHPKSTLGVLTEFVQHPPLPTDNDEGVSNG